MEILFMSQQKNSEIDPKSEVVPEDSENPESSKVTRMIILGPSASISQTELVGKLHMHTVQGRCIRYSRKRGQTSGYDTCKPLLSNLIDGENSIDEEETFKSS